MDIRRKEYIYENPEVAFLESMAKESGQLAEKLMQMAIPSKQQLEEELELALEREVAKALEEMHEEMIENNAREHEDMVKQYYAEVEENHRLFDQNMQDEMDRFNSLSFQELNEYRDEERKEELAKEFKDELDMDKAERSARR